jgi:hypothetical protein
LKIYEQKNVKLSENRQVLNDTVHEQSALGVTRFYKPNGNVCSSAAKYGDYESDANCDASNRNA